MRSKIVIEIVVTTILTAVWVVVDAVTVAETWVTPLHEVTAERILFILCQIMCASCVFRSGRRLT